MKEKIIFFPKIQIETGEGDREEYKAKKRQKWKEGV
jgi:hypothetical protein